MSETSLELQWRTLSGVRLSTIAKSYIAGQDVAFEWSVPDGAEGTSQANRSRDAVIVQWPAFTKRAFDGVLSWEGSFMAATRRLSKGSVGGPAVAVLVVVLASSASDAVLLIEQARKLQPPMRRCPLLIGGERVPCQRCYGSEHHA